MLIDDLLRQTKEAQPEAPGAQIDLFSEFNGIPESVDRTEWSASPTFVLVEGPPGLLKAHFLDKLVGALNEGLNILRCTHTSGAGVLQNRSFVQ